MRTIFLSLSLLTLINQGHAGQSHDHEVSIISRYLFLDTPSLADEPDFRIRASSLQLQVNGQWVPWKVKSLLLSLNPVEDADGTYLLGIPSLILKSQTVDVSPISRDDQIVEGCALADTVYVVKQDMVEPRVYRDDFVVPKLTVYKKGASEFIEVGSFLLAENPFHQILGRVIGFNNHLIVLSMSSSRFEYENLAIFFDVATAKPVGYFDFSEITYSWKTGTLCIVGGVLPHVPGLLEEMRKTPFFLKWGEDTLKDFKHTSLFSEVKGSP